jgi:hypothetical protein
VFVGGAQEEKRLEDRNWKMEIGRRRVHAEFAEDAEKSGEKKDSGARS